MRTVGNALRPILLCILLILGSAAVGQRRYERAGPDSFLRFPVDSTEELAAALRSDPALRKRYARHFRVSEAEFIAFVKRALVLYRLPRARAVTVYGVTRSGRIYPVRTRLRRGTRVWATRSGVPILKWQCSNPLTRTLPGLALSSPPRTARRSGFRAGRTASLPARYGIFDLAGPDIGGLPSASPPLTLMPVRPVSLTDMSLEDLMNMEFKPEPVQPAVAGPAPRVGALPWGILGIGAVSYALARSGSSGSAPRPAQEVPEPGTAGLLAAGALLRAALLRIRKRTVQADDR